MYINELNNMEKSVILAKLSGFKVMNTMAGEPRRVFCMPDGYQFGGSIYYSVSKRMTREEEFLALCPDFYNPANMALLAISLAWLSSVTHWEPHIGKWAIWMQHFTDGMNPLHLHEWMCKSADAGIRLAIEAGLCTPLPETSPEKKQRFEGKPV